MMCVRAHTRVVCILHNKIIYIYNMHTVRAYYALYDVENIRARTKQVYYSSRVEYY